MEVELISQNIRTTTGQDIELICPKCLKTTKAGLEEISEKNKFLGIIPHKYTYVKAKCHSCGKTHRYEMSLDSVFSSSKEDLQQHCNNVVPASTKLFVLISFLFIVLPWINIFLFSASFFATRKCYSGWRTAARRGLIISVLLDVIGILLMIFVGPENM